MTIATLDAASRAALDADGYLVPPSTCSGPPRSAARWVCAQNPGYGAQALHADVAGPPRPAARTSRSIAAGRARR